MKSIRLHSSFSTGLDRALASCSELLIEDQPLGSGGFGEVYRCNQVDARRVQPLVVKLFLKNNPDAARRCMETIQLLQRRLGDEQRKMAQNGTSLFVAYPTLSAAPLLSFAGTLDGNAVSGYVATDLGSAGMDELSDVLEDDACHKRFQSNPLYGKIEMARQLVSALEFLNTKISFLHCDLKPDALFFKTKPALCVLIDFDGGAVLRHPNDEPTTFGTLQDWLAPEIVTQVMSPGAGGTVKVSLASEQWSMAVAAHFLIFGCSPHFFLSEVSDRAVKAYTAQFTWPEIDPSFQYYRAGIAPVYNQYLKCVKGALPEELRRHFSFTFSQGYFNPSQRTTFSQWITAFGAIQQPAIHSFTADRATVNDKRPVRLGWEVTGARRLELRGIGDVTGRDFQDLMVSQSRVFELVLMPKSGNPITKSLRIEVDNRPPTIRSFQVDKTFLPDARPARLHWQVTGAVRVEITPSIGDVTGKPFVDVTPRQDTTYRLRAISGMDVEVSATVQVMVSKRAPVIEKFEVSPTVAFVGDEVSISWKISGAEVVSVSPSIGQVNLVGLRKIRATQTSSFTITAASHFGVVSTRVLSIYVAKRTALNVAPTTYAAERQTLNHLPTKLLTPSHENRRHITELVGSRADGWWKRRTKGTIT